MAGRRRLSGTDGVNFLRQRSLNPATSRRYGGALKRVAQFHCDNSDQHFLTSERTLNLEAVVRNLHDGFYAFLFDQFGIEALPEGDEGLETATLTDNGVGYGSVASYRSALQNALKKHRPRLRLTEEQEEEMSEVFKTLKKLDARRRKDRGEGARLTGKAPLPQPVYRELLQYFLKDNADATCWSHLYLCLTWNLMCRADNTDHLAVADLGWENDALTVRFAMAKNDQAGTKGDLQRHLYANPLDPVLCPITALGLYLMSSSAPGALLFTASRQQKSLGEHMRDFFKESPEGKALCERLGIDSDVYATHSVRKGSTSWCACGTTASPSVLATLTRGGWATGAAWERYMHLLGNGQDCYIGRVLTCLPVTSPEFARLPPHFDAGHEDVVQEALQSIFGGVLEKHPHLAVVLRHCLASVAHHADGLLAILPARHQLRHKKIFSDHAYRLSIQRCLYTADRFTSPFMTATGIPPHAQQLRELNKLQVKMAETYAAVTGLPDRVADRMEEMLEARAIERGNLTPTVMRNLLSEAISHLQIPQPASNHIEPAIGMPGPSSPAAAAAGSTGRLDIYYWGGGMHLVPEDWRLPGNANLKTAWELWCSGHPVPYRKLNSRDRVHDHKRFNDWKTVFGKVATFLKKKGRWIEQPTVVQAREMFNAAEPFFRRILHKARRFEELRPSYAAQFFRPVKDPLISELATAL